jgi:hypothetical protein
MESLGKQAEHLEWQSLFTVSITDLPQSKDGLGELVITLLNGVKRKVMESHYSSFYQLSVPTIHSGHSL